MKKMGIEQPFLPKRDVSFVLMDGRTPQKITNSLRKLGINIIKTPCCGELYESIAYHPDILVHPIDDKNIVVAPNVYTIMKKSLEDLGYHVIRGERILMRNYPENIAYNIARISKFAIHNFKYTDPYTLKIFEKKGIEFIDVKQGYSKCSICIVNENSIITSDKGISKAVEKNGIEALLISPGYIDLPGLNYGFIGGISGFIGAKKLVFSGHLNHHPDHLKILKFLDDHQVEPIFLGQNIPIDIGSIIPLLEMEY